MNRFLAILVSVAAIAGFGYWALAPRPIAVDTAQTTRGPLRVTVDQQGEVRVHDRYSVAAPVAGRLLRIVLHDGDPVKVGQPIATLQVAPLDARQTNQGLAQLDAARNHAREAEQSMERARAEMTLAEREVDRAERLVREKFLSTEAAEKTRTALETNRRAHAAAQARVQAAQADVRAAEAALGQRARDIVLTAPASGNVLRVLEASERTIAAGTTVMVIGDPAKLEIVADVLSTDAVRIEPGADVDIERWGGAGVLKARVRTIEPYAFTKVSALGVEEKRVNVIMDPVGTLDRLGDGYRVEARIVVWSGADVVKVPANALFRVGGDWYVFALEDGRARSRKVVVGARNPEAAQILDGLGPGTTVIQYPGNQIKEGLRVRARANL